MPSGCLRNWLKKEENNIRPEWSAKRGEPWKILQKIITYKKINLGRPTNSFLMLFTLLVRPNLTHFLKFNLILGPIFGSLDPKRLGWPSGSQNGFNWLGLNSNRVQIRVQLYLINPIWTQSEPKRVGPSESKSGLSRVRLALRVKIRVGLVWVHLADLHCTTTA